MVQFTHEMGRIAQVLRRASDERARRLSQLRNQTRHTLAEAQAAVRLLGRDRQRAGAQLERSAAEAHKAANMAQAARLKQARRRKEQGLQHRRGLAQFVAGLRQEVGGMLSESRRHMQAFAADFAGGAESFRKTSDFCATRKMRNKKC